MEEKDLQYIFMSTSSDNLDVMNVWLYKDGYKVFDDKDRALDWFVSSTNETKQYGKHFLKKCNQAFLDLVEMTYN